MITEQEIEQYQNDGFVPLQREIPQILVSHILDQASHLARSSPPGVTLEKDGQTIRAIQGPQLNNRFFEKLTQYPPFVSAAERILGGRVYVHQVKLNMKAPFVGDTWPWHEDFVFWQKLDGIERPDLVTIMIALDGVTEFNGPLIFAPGSHQLYEENTPQCDMEHSEQNWQLSFTSDLQFQLSPEFIKKATDKRELDSPKGDCGSIICFHPRVAHASGINLSPFPRRVLLITYNLVLNPPLRNDRPDFVCSKDIREIKPSFELVDYEELSTQAHISMFTSSASKFLVKRNPELLVNGIIDQKTNLFREGLLDSLTTAEYVVFLERYFGVTVSDFSTIVPYLSNFESTFRNLIMSCAKNLQGCSEL